MELLKTIDLQKANLALCIDRRLAATCILERLRSSEFFDLFITMDPHKGRGIVLPLPIRNPTILESVVEMLVDVEALYSLKVAEFQQSIVLLEKQAALADGQ